MGRVVERVEPGLERAPAEDLAAGPRSGRPGRTGSARRRPRRSSSRCRRPCSRRHPSRPDDQAGPETQVEREHRRRPRPRRAGPAGERRSRAGRARSATGPRRGLQRRRHGQRRVRARQPPEQEVLGQRPVVGDHRAVAGEGGHRRAGEPGQLVDLGRPARDRVRRAVVRARDVGEDPGSPEDLRIASCENAIGWSEPSM